MEPATAQSVATTVAAVRDLRLKHVAVLDIMAVSMGFVILGLAGAGANRLPVPNWFVLVPLFGALYGVVGERNAEATRIGDDTIDENSSRPVLASYPPALAAAGPEPVPGRHGDLSYAVWACQDVGRDTFAPVVAGLCEPRG